MTREQRIALSAGKDGNQVKINIYDASTGEMYLLTSVNLDPEHAVQFATNIIKAASGAVND